MNKFMALDVAEPLAAALEKQGITEPTPIQQKAMPLLFEGKNLIGQAPTGTGKTLAYLLPILQHIDAEAKQVPAVVLAPTYELAMQIANVARDLVQAAGLGIAVQGLIGGANITRQIDGIKKKKPQLIVGSAGRIVELARMHKLKLGGVRQVVLDEFDRLLDDQNADTIRDFVQMLIFGNEYAQGRGARRFPRTAGNRARRGLGGGSQPLGKPIPHRAVP